MGNYTKEQIENAYKKILELLKIVGELEETFEGRVFTLDGHLVGSIGEVLAAYYYGIELYPPSTPKHDGVSPDGQEVQIKITQRGSIMLNEEPDYLIVLYLDRKTGEIKEVYNGKGKAPWETSYLYKKRNTNYMTLSKLIKLDEGVNDVERIPQLHQVGKFEKKNHDVLRTSGSAGKTLTEGYVNSRNQKNCGCTGKEGNHKGQLLYAMKCLDCGFEYEANGCDVWLRKCPKCSN